MASSPASSSSSSADPKHQPPRVSRPHRCNDRVEDVVQVNTRRERTTKNQISIAFFLSLFVSFSTSTTFQPSPSSSGLCLPPPRPPQARPLHALRVPSFRTGLGASRLLSGAEGRERVPEGEGHRRRRENHQQQRRKVIFLCLLLPRRDSLHLEVRFFLCFYLIFCYDRKESNHAGDDQKNSSL